MKLVRYLVLYEEFSGKIKQSYKFVAFVFQSRVNGTVKSIYNSKYYVHILLVKPQLKLTQEYLSLK